VRQECHSDEENPLLWKGSQMFKATGVPGHTCILFNHGD
jgi:hypothetical protein